MSTVAPSGSASSTGTFAPIFGNTVASASPDGVSTERRLLLSKRYFSGPLPRVGKDADVLYEMQESQKVEVPNPAPPMGSLPVTLLDSSLWKPCDLMELNTYAKRRAFVEPIIHKALQVPEDTLLQVCNELITMISKKAPMFPMDTKTLQIFALALIANDLSISSVIEEGASWQIEGVNVWLFRLKGMPGPNFATVPLQTNSYYHWYHAGGLETVFGAFATGTILPCCSDGFQLPPQLPLPGFFARVRREDTQITEQQLLHDCKEMHSHGKNAHGIHFSGAILGNHIKLSRASTWLEQFASFRAGLVKSKSTDKSWCVRADCGKIQFVCLTCKPVV